jgi:hypothetical protein
MSLETTHRERPWRVHAVAHDFQIEDMWTFDLGGRTPNDIRDFLACFWGVMGGLSDTWLAKVRLRVGDALRWDDHDFSLPIPGCTETSVSARLSDVDRKRNLSAPGAPSPLSTPKLNTVYVMREEALFEFSNDTIHGLLHVALAETNATLAVYVKHRGALSRVYMAAIWPARHLILYPSLIRKLEASWARASGTARSP